MEHDNSPGLSFVVVSSDTVNFHTFKTMVVILGGETLGQSGQGHPSLPRESDMFAMGDDLMREGYDVHPFNEDNVSSSGSGDTYDRVKRHKDSHQIESLVAIGHSHGAGSVYDLCDRVNTNIAGLTISLTAYIDAVENDSDIDTDTEVRLPPGSGYHINHWQPYPFEIFLDVTVNGASIPTSDEDHQELQFTGITPPIQINHALIAEEPTVLSNIQNGVLNERSTR